MVRNERIHLFFAANGGRRSVARINDRVRRKGQKFVPDALHQKLPIATRKIVAADAVLKEHVAAENDVGLIAIQKNDVARGMARDIEHFQADSSLFNDAALTH